MTYINDPLSLENSYKGAVKKLLDLLFLHPDWTNEQYTLSLMENNSNNTIFTPKQVYNILYRLRLHTVKLRRERIYIIQRKINIKSLIFDLDIQKNLPAIYAYLLRSNTQQRVVKEEEEKDEYTTPVNTIDLQISPLESESVPYVKPVEESLYSADIEQVPFKQTVDTQAAKDLLQQAPIQTVQEIQKQTLSVPLLPLSEESKPVLQLERHIDAKNNTVSIKVQPDEKNELRKNKSVAHKTLHIGFTYLVIIFTILLCIFGIFFYTTFFKSNSNLQQDEISTPLQY